MISKQTAKLVAGLQTFLRGLCPPLDFPVWRTLDRGIDILTVDDLRKALKEDDNDREYRVSDWADDIMSKPDFQQNLLNEADSGLTLSLHSATVEELTGKKEKEGVEFSKIQEAILRVGELLPAWAGPLLRLRYPDQPRDERLIMGMEAITDSHGYPIVFSLEHDSDGLWLSTDLGHAGYFRYDFDRFVFCSRK
jgi:hypothetical protein